MIYLRKMNLTDVDDVLSWENDPINWHYSDTEGAYSRNDIVHLVGELSKPGNVQQRYIICESDSGKRIGTVDLFEIDEQSGEAGVGILIAESGYRRRGLANSALLLLEKECDQYNIVKLNATVHLWNKPSLALFGKAGYQEVGQSDELVKFEKCLRS